MGRSLLILSLLILFFLLSLTSSLQASEDKLFRIDWYSFEGSQGFSFKHQAFPYIFLTLNGDYYPFRPSIQIGTNLYLPQQLFIFSLYGGGGAAIDLYGGEGIFYLLMGVDASILFVEGLYYIPGDGLKNRMGLRFSF